MSARADHHVALRVTDLERAIRFYEEALGGRLVAAPIMREGPYIEEVFGPGAVVRVCHVAFAANALELWQFLAPVVPIPPQEQSAVGIMHFAVTVDDVPATLARVEAAGGKARFPVKSIGGDSPGRFVYCEDPDGHVFELLSVDHPETVRIIVAGNPDAVVTP
jgi:catechol 2,3-dioxygenase-like lactoylglutathione lyase family enzyme